MTWAGPDMGVQTALWGRFQPNTPHERRELQLFSRVIAKGTSKATRGTIGPPLSLPLAVPM